MSQISCLASCIARLCCNSMQASLLPSNAMQHCNAKFSQFFSQQVSQEIVSSCQMNKALYLCKISLPYLALSDVTIKNILSRCSSEVLSKAPTTSFLFLDLHVSVSAPNQPKCSVMSCHGLILDKSIVVEHAGEEERFKNQVSYQLQ